MKRLCTPGWLARHVAALALVVAFLALGWWQISRAVQGNTLSWAYAVEWPFFAGFVVFIWFREVRRTLHEGSSPDVSKSTDVEGTDGADVATTSPGFRRPVRTARAAATEDHPDNDPELADYNRYLRWLNANPGARPVDYPG